MATASGSLWELKPRKPPQEPLPKLLAVSHVICRQQAVPPGAQYSLELLHEGAMVSNVLPKALKNSADVIANCELVIELTGGSSMLDI